MQSSKGSTDTLGALKCTDEELPDGSAVFTFEGNDEDMELIVKTGMLSVVKDDRLNLEGYLAPNFDELDDDVKIRNYFFALTVKNGLETLLEETLSDKQLNLFE